jgi:hypothetical protein
MPGRSTLKFATGPETGLKTVQKVVPLEIFLAAGITDGEGKKSNRVVFRAKGTKQFYFMFQKGTEEAMRPAAQWLQDLLCQTSDSSDAPIPEDLVKDIPVGDPLEE